MMMVMMMMVVVVVVMMMMMPTAGLGKCFEQQHLPSGAYIDSNMH